MMAFAKNCSGLSVQSGDITRTALRNEDPEAPSAGVFYAFLFPKLHRITKVVFCHPACSLLIAMLFLVITVLASVLVLLLWPPTLNFSLRSFQVPNHISSIRWDALRAAESGNFTTDVSDEATSLMTRRLARNTAPSFKRATGSAWPACPNSVTAQTQHIMHAYWALSLVYVVPKRSTNQNVFSKLNRIYEIEQHIYNNPNYIYFCHKCWTCTVCDPVNSILTYFYNNKQVPNSGLVKDTSSRLVSIMAQYPSSVLWYTGGKLNNYSSTLLRSEVRIGIPLPCFDSVGSASLAQQHDLVQAFFVSFIPYLDEASSE